MTLHTPERMVSPIPRCGFLVSAGMMSYPCTLLQGHYRDTDPDPEPHYVEESTGARQAWSNWKQRQIDREEAALQQQAALPRTADEQGLVPCPSCDEKSLLLDRVRNVATCQNPECRYTGDLIPDQAPYVQPPSHPHIAVSDDVVSQWVQQNAEAMEAPQDVPTASVQSLPNLVPEPEQVAQHVAMSEQPIPDDNHCRSITEVHEPHFVIYEPRQGYWMCTGGQSAADPMRMPPVPDPSQVAQLVQQAKQHRGSGLISEGTEIEIHWIRGADDQGVGEMHLYDTLPPQPEPYLERSMFEQPTVSYEDVVGFEPDPQAHQHIPSQTPAYDMEQMGQAPGVPTKQRPGDQPLPTDGHGQMSVQDFIISTMQESKRVGTERYGQPLMQFDSRSNLQDMHDEARDFFVYTGKMLQMAEADRPVLEGVVAKVLSDAIAAGAEHGGVEYTELGRLVVDALMDWVTTHTHLV